MLETHEEAITEMLRQPGELAELAEQLCISTTRRCNAAQIEKIPSEARLAGLTVEVKPAAEGRRAAARTRRPYDGLGPARPARSRICLRRPPRDRPHPSAKRYEARAAELDAGL
jgi:hypothetical protein